MILFLLCLISLSWSQNLVENYNFNSGNGEGWFYNETSTVVPHMEYGYKGTRLYFFGADVTTTGNSWDHTVKYVLNGNNRVVPGQWYRLTFTGWSDTNQDNRRVIVGIGTDTGDRASIKYEIRAKLKGASSAYNALESSTYDHTIYLKAPSNIDPNNARLYFDYGHDLGAFNIDIIKLEPTSTPSNIYRGYSTVAGTTTITECGEQSSCGGYVPYGSQDEIEIVPETGYRVSYVTDEYKLIGYDDGEDRLAEYTGLGSKSFSTPRNGPEYTTYYAYSEGIWDIKGLVAEGQGGTIKCSYDNIDANYFECNESFFQVIDPSKRVYFKAFPSQGYRLKEFLFQPKVFFPDGVEPICLDGYISTANPSFKSLENLTPDRNDADFLRHMLTTTASFERIPKVIVACQDNSEGRCLGGGQSVDPGSPVTMIVEADAGFYLSSVTLSPAGNNFSFDNTHVYLTNVQVNTTINLLFTSKEYNVHLQTTTGGTIDGGLSTRKTLHGNSETFRANVTNNNYRFKHWENEHGSVYSTSQTWTKTITSETTVKAVFEKIPYTVTVQDVNGHGTVSPSHLSTVYKGNSMTVSVTPGNGYDITSIKVFWGNSSTGIPITNGQSLAVIGAPTIRVQYEALPEDLICSGWRYEINYQVQNPIPMTNCRFEDTPGAVTPEQPWLHTLRYSYNFKPNSFYKITFRTQTASNHTRGMNFGFVRKSSPYLSTGKSVELNSTLTYHEAILMTPSGFNSNEDEWVYFDFGHDAGKVIIDRITLTEVDAIVPLTISKTGSGDVSCNIAESMRSDCTGSYMVPMGAQVIINAEPSTNNHIESFLYTTHGNPSPVPNPEQEKTFTITTQAAIDVAFSIDTYSILQDIPTGNGAISYTGVHPVPYNQNVTLNFDADIGYAVDYVKITSGGSTITRYDISKWDFTNVIDASNAVEVHFKVADYKITASSSQNGTVSPNGVTQVTHGATPTYVGVANDGFRVASIQVNNLPLITGSDSYRFAPIVQGPQTIHFEFEAIPTYTIQTSVNNSAWGSTSFDGRHPVREGEDVTVTFSPATNYTVDYVLVTTKQGTVTETGIPEKEFVNVTDQSNGVEVFFKRISHSVNIVSQTNDGIIDVCSGPSCLKSVNQGDFYNFIIKPKDGFKVVSVDFNGTISTGYPKGDIPYTTPEAITQYTTINVTYSALPDHNLTITAVGGFGTVDLCGTATSCVIPVQEDKAVTMVITLDGTHKIKSIKYNGIQVPGSPYGYDPVTYTTILVQAAATVAIEFEDLPRYTVGYNENISGAGTFTPVGTYPVVYGHGVTVNIAAKPGYTLVKTTLNGGTVDLGGVVTITNIIDNSNYITAEFVEVKHEITVTSNTGGTVLPNKGIISVGEGASLTLTESPYQNFRLKHIVHDGATITGQSSLTISGITKDHSVHFEYEPIPTYLIEVELNNSSYGEITTTDANPVREGGDVTFTITAFENYELEKVEVTTTASYPTVVDKGAITKFTFSSVTGPNNKIKAYFKRIQHTMTIVPSIDGTTAPTAGSYEVAQGIPFTFTATPQEGYDVSAIKVTTASSGTITYTNKSSVIIPDVQEAHTFEAKFKPKEFTLTPVFDAASGAIEIEILGGTIPLQNGIPFTIGYGLSFVIHIKDTEGFSIVKVLYDEVNDGKAADDLGRVNEISKPTMVDDVIVTALFKSTLCGDPCFTPKYGRIDIHGTWLINGNLRNTNPHKISAGRVVITKEWTTTMQFPDYVFESSYELKSLENIEAYVNANSHLEGIPSAHEFGRDGMDMAKTSVQLLEKVEELTLHFIELNKNYKEQGTSLVDLKKEIENN